MQSQGFDDTSGDIVIADDSSGDSSGNDSALDPSSCSASPQNTPGLGLQNLLHVKLPNTTNNNNNVIAHNITQLTPAQREDVNLKLLGNAPIPIRPHLISSANLDNSSSSNVKSKHCGTTAKGLSSNLFIYMIVKYCTLQK